MTDEKKKSVKGIIRTSLLVVLFASLLISIAFLVLKNTYDASAGFHGDIILGVDANLISSLAVANSYFPTYSTTNNIIYTPNCLVECHQPIEFKYNGTLAPITLPLEILNITTILQGL